jgi:hypothetical protein
MFDSWGLVRAAISVEVQVPRLSVRWTLVVHVRDTVAVSIGWGRGRLGDDASSTTCSEERREEEIG